MAQLRINPDRLHASLEALAQIGRTPDGAVNRIAFSDADIEGREFVKNLLLTAGLRTRVDEAGNLFGRRDGAQGGAPAILLGSHIDTVPGGGAFDGALGVLAAIEVARTLEENGFENRHPLEVAVWSDEEGGLSGSRAFIGDLPRAELDRVLAGGVTLGDGIERLGGTPARIEDALCDPRDIAAYVELHVEQGGRLESNGVDTGVVSGIVGICHYAVTFNGISNHAGTTPMDQRHNALLAASDFVLAVDRIVVSVPGAHVGTVGELRVYPGAANVIPGRVQLTVELRDLEMVKIDSLWALLEPELERCANTYRTTTSTEIEHAVPGTPTDPRIQQILSDAADVLSLTHLTMPSGAGHDAQNLARVTPTGMIFVPSVGGLSHSGAEYTRPEDAENGANLLLASFVRMDREI
jgi:N-carbamoyl-L-amino-acid hydrolase